MPFQLQVIRGVKSGDIHTLDESRPTSVGRSIDCTVHLDDPSASRHHCQIVIDGGRAMIEDVGSSWGTAVNGESVTQGELKSGDVITVGETELRFETVSSPDAVTMVKPPRLVAKEEKPKAAGQEVPIPGPKGQAEPQEIPIPGPGHQPSSKEVPISPPGRPPAPPKIPIPPTDRPAAPKRVPMPDLGRQPVPVEAGMSMPDRQPAPADLTDLVGSRVLGYDIQAVVARARTGIVYRAHESAKNRVVAFKVFYPTMFKDLTAKQRFTRAVNTMLPIQHENLVRLYAAGRIEDSCYTASEFVDGESAAQMIERIGISGMLPWEHTLRIAAYVARALQVAEEHNIVHRNVTPRNILIRNSDRVAKLGDLIFAKAVEGLNAIQVTNPGELVGDLSYMPPEQTGAGGPVDCRSDIYCLGATLYALLTGRPPLEGRNPADTIMKIRTQQPDEPTKYHLSIPPLFEDVILHMLAKRPDDRYQTAADLLTDLERAAKYQGTSLPS